MEVRGSMSESPRFVAPHDMNPPDWGEERLAYPKPDTRTDVRPSLLRTTVVTILLATCGSGLAFAWRAAEPTAWLAKSDAPAKPVVAAEQFEAVRQQIQGMREALDRLAGEHAATMTRIAALEAK